MPIKLNHIIKFSCKPVQQFYGQYDIMRSEFQRFVNQNYHIVVLVETETKVERMQAMLSEMHIPSITKLHRSMSSGQAVIIEGSLSEGFELPDMGLVVITERELLNQNRKSNENVRKLSQMLKN